MFPTQECGDHWKDPSTWSWRAHEQHDKEMFACQTRTDSGNDSESLCEPYLCSEALGFRQCPYVALKPTEDGWHTSSDSSPAPPNLPSTPQSCWQPCSNAGTSQGSWVFREHGKSGAIEEHLAGKWQHHCIAGSSRIPSSRVPFRYYPFRRLCYFVQQRHFSLGRQG